MWLFALLTLALGALLSFIISYLIETPVKTKHNTAYTQPGSRLVFLVRLAWSSVLVWGLQRQRPRRLNNYRVGNRDPRYCGVVHTPEEELLEASVSLTTDRHEDSISLWGVDAVGRAVYVSVARLAHGRAAFMLLIRDQDGQLYTVPNQPDSGVQQYSGEGWRAPGLLVECVQPMRTWRIKYSGYLRKGSRLEYNTELSPADEDGVMEARLDLVWRSLKAPVDLFKESSPFLLAAALAREGDCDVKYFTSLDRDGYDQLGVLAGTVQLGAAVQPDQPLWYLRGSRLRRWGMGEAATKLHRSVTLLSMLNNGDFLFFTTFCYPASLTHCSFGYLQMACGLYLPISSTNFNMADVGEDGNLPSHIFFHCSAGGRLVEVCITLSEGSARYCTGDPWTLQHDLCLTKVYVGPHAGAGIAVFTRSYSELCPVPESESVAWPLTSSSEVTANQDALLVTGLSDERCGDMALSGGKGASLAVLSALQQRPCPEKFLVPEGITVTTNAWLLQLDSSPSVTAAIQGFERAVGSGQDGQIKDACDK
ncbi:hypothetical protein FHG87_006686 [Trinorchestia longiramus]|nr:hypothetical protein FHG87_006686 [Trinorchestia longiramus]